MCHLYSRKGIVSGGHSKQVIPGCLKLMQLQTTATPVTT